MLEKLKALERKAKKELARVRRIKRETRPPKSTSDIMAQFIEDRKGMPPEVEIHMINRLMDRTDLSAYERNSLRVRRKSLMSRLTNDKS